MKSNKVERIFGNEYVDNNIRNLYFAAFGIAGISLLADIFGYGQYTTKIIEAGTALALGGNIVEIIGNRIYNFYGNLTTEGSSL